MFRTEGRESKLGIEYLRRLPSLSKFATGPLWEEEDSEVEGGCSEGNMADSGCKITKLERWRFLGLCRTGACRWEGLESTEAKESTPTYS